MHTTRWRNRNIPARYYDKFTREVGGPPPQELTEALQRTCANLQEQMQRVSQAPTKLRTGPRFDPRPILKKMGKSTLSNAALGTK